MALQLPWGVPGRPRTRLLQVRENHVCSLRDNSKLEGNGCVARQPFSCDLAVRDEGNAALQHRGDRRLRRDLGPGWSSGQGGCRRDEVNPPKREG
jgi:hypothetical protein